MIAKLLQIGVFITILGILSGCGQNQNQAKTEIQEVQQRMKKYVPAPMPFDLSGYSASEKELLKTLIDVGKLADQIFWRQTYPYNIELRKKVVAEFSEDNPVRKFFFMQAGPFDRLDNFTLFMKAEPRPVTAGFYPVDLTKKEFDDWISAHPDDKESFLSPYTVIKRVDGGLKAVPYHEEYKEFIDPMADGLRKAAKLAENASFKKYLLSKADALQNDRYFQTDVDWIDIKGSKFDMVLGPFEVYEDELNNIKASYEASVEIVDQAESAKLNAYTSHLNELEQFLPYADKFKVKGAGLTAAFAIVRDIYRGGDLRVGYQAVAANLPNDPEIHAKKGSKKTFWKNILDARLDRIIMPISRRLIQEDQLPSMTAQGFFDFVLMHEIAHALGPRYVFGTKTPVNVKLGDLYSWIEENKADLAGLHSLRYLQENGIIDSDLREQHLVSYLGSIFRTIRFGTGEAHGKAAIVSLNYLMEKGGITYDKASGRYAVNFDKINTGITGLTRELLTIEAEGDYDRAKRLEEKYGGTPDFVQKSLNSLNDLPIDLVPVYENKWE